MVLKCVEAGEDPAEVKQMVSEFEQRSSVGSVFGALAIWMIGAIVLFVVAAIAMVISSFVFTILGRALAATGIEALEVIVGEILGKLLGGGVLFFMAYSIREEYDFPFAGFPILLGGLYGIGVAMEGQLWWF